MGRLKRLVWWAVHVTTAVLIVLMVFSYLPNSWVGRYKHETGSLTDDVAGQYIIWSGRIEGVLVFEDYSRERVEKSLAQARAMREEGVIIDRPRYRTESLWLRAVIWMQRPQGVFALPRFSYRRKQGDWDYGELLVSLPMSYPLILSGACSLLLLRSRLRRIPVGCCQSCGYLLDGVSGDVCPECASCLVEER